VRVLQNAYVLAAYGNGSIPPMTHHKQDLTRHALCSRWSKMLHNAPELSGAGREGRRPTRNPEQVLKWCESQDDTRKTGPRKIGASGAVRVHP
jgi:hypothetical protein